MVKFFQSLVTHIGLVFDEAHFLKLQKSIVFHTAKVIHLNLMALDNHPLT